jgi:hypothetical protein
MGRRLNSILVTSLNLLIWAASAQAYPTPVDFSGKLLRWNIDKNSPAITYAIDAENPEDAVYYQDAVAQAAQLWSEVPGSYFKFESVSLDQAPQVTIYLRSSLSDVRETAGYTMFDEYEGDTPKHCSIYVMVDRATSDYWMGKIFLHELGHAVGLGHSLVPEAIMSYSLDANGFSLDLDDYAAAAHSYPANGDKPRLPLGCSVRSDAGQVSSSNFLILLLLVPVFFSLWPACGRSLSSRAVARLRAQPPRSAAPANTPECPLK